MLSRNDRDGEPERGASARGLYAEYLEQAEGREAVSFEEFAARHPDNAAALTDLHLGMKRVDSALSQDGRRAARPAPREPQDDAT